MKAAIAETNRRRKLQEEFNRANGITPQSIVKRIDEVLTSVYERDYFDYTRVAEDKEESISRPQKRWKRINSSKKRMKEASKALEFEKAARLRDEIARLKKFELELE